MEQVCLKTFGRIDHLRKHIQTHLKDEADLKFTLTMCEDELIVQGDHADEDVDDN